MKNTNAKNSGNSAKTGTLVGNNKRRGKGKVYPVIDEHTQKVLKRIAQANGTINNADRFKK